MNDNIGDIFDMGEPTVPPASLEVLQKELKHATELEAIVEQLEEDLKNAKKSLHHSKTARIPDMMNELAIPKITYCGYNCVINDFVSGSLPNEDNPVAREAAIEYLVSHEAASLIKTEVKAEFGRGGHNEALALKAQLEEEGYATTMKTGVHAMTLAAWARERLKNGDAIDTEVLGLYTGKVAKLTKVKEKK